MKSHKRTDILLCALFMLCLCGFGVWVLLKPPSTLSVAERRELSSLPAPTVRSVADGSWFEDTEDALPDQFPLRDLFRRVKALNQYYLLGQTDNHDILLQKGHAAEIVIPTEKSVNVFFKRLNQLNDRYFSPSDSDETASGRRLFTTLIPDKLFYLADDVGLTGCPTVDYADLRARMKSEAPGTYLDIFDLLALDDYYTTDAHWREEAILDVADSLLSRMGRPVNGATAPGDPLSPFYGVYYGRSALPLAPDSITCVHSDEIDAARVLRADRNTKSLEDAKLYYEEYITANDPYDVYLGGACTVTVIENTLRAADTTSDGKTLCFLGDSFGRSLAPLLLAGYDRIVFYDLRYISASFAFDFLPIPDDADVLLAYSMATVNVADILRAD